MPEFNKYLAVGKAEFEAFSGATANSLNNKVKKSLGNEKIDSAIIHVGVNNLLNSSENYSSIVKSIIDIGNTCKKLGTKNIFISSILFSYKIDSSILNFVNKSLYDQCILHGFHFINNNNFDPSNLWSDGLHLNESGKVVLANNFIHFVNSFLCQTHWVPYLKQ